MHHTSSQMRRRDKRFTGNEHDKDEDLALFQEMEHREREDANSLSLVRGTPAIALPEGASEDIFSSNEWDKHDYDWLLTPPLTSCLTSLDHVPVSNGSTQTGSAVGKSNPKVKSGSSRSDPPVARRISLTQEPVRPGVDSTSSKVSQKCLSASTRPSTRSCSATPAARSSIPSKSAVSSASIRSSTPTGRATTPFNHLVSSRRPSTPSNRQATPTIVHNSSTASLGPLPVNKSNSSPSKSVPLMRPSSPATKARQPAALSGTSLELPPNLRTSAAGRPLSNPRGSLALKANATASAKKGQRQPADVGAQKRGVSSSPLVAKVCASANSFNGDKSMVRKGKSHDPAMIARSNDAIGKKADKVVLPRKALMLSQEKIPVASDTQTKKPVKSASRGEIRSTLRESSGFGRNLSRTSLDMAIRHMDIRGTALSGCQSFMSNVPPSSLYSVRSTNSKGNSNGHGHSVIPITSSPTASSTTASSEHCMSIIIDRDSSELGDEMSSEMGSRASPRSQRERSMALYNERKVSQWLGSPGGMEAHDGADIMQIFEQELASLSGPESPLVSQPDGIIDCDDFMLDTMY